MIICEDGATRWYNERRILHREDGPAFISRDGTEEAWFYNGKLHRDDGPAFIYHLLYRHEYFKNGLRHRIHGPAIVTHEKEWWYLEGKHLLKEEHQKICMQNGLLKINLFEED